MLLIKNGLIVTMDKEKRIIRDGCLLVRGDRITGIGTAQEVGEVGPGDEVIEAKGMVVIPGFVSTHNHLYSAVVRSIPYAGFEKADFSFISWMERFWLPLLEDKVTREQLYIGTLANCLEHIHSGITTTSDTAEGSYALPGALDMVDQAVMESGMRGVISFETTGRISPQNAQLGLGENVRFVEKARRRGGRVEGRLGVHTTFTCPTELLKQVREEANRLGAGLMMHLADDRWHTFDTTRRFGQRPVKYLEDIGFLGPDVLLFHCSYIDPLQDPEIFRQYDVKVAHNAESNAIFGFWPNMMPLLKAGVTVGLGTDGQTHSMFEIMRTAQMIHRIRYENLEILPDAQVLEMATIEGAKCLQKENEIGSLEVGKKADIVLISDARSTVPLFEHNVASYVVGTCERGDVDMVIIDGNIVVRHGELKTVDEAQVIAECRKEARLLWEKNNWPLP
ncbi:MAG: amidohydrolase family protein [Chloroflexi bacterium]|nr:amidohydrolase family protein [Chloroflexota bacterium]